MDPSARNVVALLSDEHLQLQALSTELIEAEPTPDLVDVLTAQVTRHLSAEHRYLYPVVQSLFPEGEWLVEQELSQDQVILRRLGSLRVGGPMAFAQTVDELVRDLRRHAFASANDILPRLRELSTQDDLLELGELITDARHSAPTRPHPHTPDRPPWNRMIDPLIGAVDRIRDRAAHRKTSPDQL